MEGKTNNMAKVIILKSFIKKELGFSKRRTAIDPFFSQKVVEKI